jgi:predicted RNA-binding Zn-ribbon protein involved in translation (DUF1610 family)
VVCSDLERGKNAVPGLTTNCARYRFFRNVRNPGRERRCEMPLAGPAPEGRKFFCPKCGALYSVIRTQASKKEASAVKCVVCSRIMGHSELPDISVYTLIHRPEDA